MDKEQKTLFLTLWCILALEWMGLLLLIYYARLPYFIALFVTFVQLVTPWLIGLNLIFLFFTLFTKGLQFTWVFWKNYLLELLRFFIVSFGVGVGAIAVSAVVGTALGISAERVSRLPTVRQMQDWVANSFIRDEALMPAPVRSAPRRAR